MRATKQSGVASDPRVRTLEILGGIWLVAMAFLGPGGSTVHALAGALGLMTIASSTWLYHRAPETGWDPTLLLGVALLASAALSVQVEAMFVSDFLIGALLVLSALHARLPTRTDSLLR